MVKTHLLVSYKDFRVKMQSMRAVTTTCSCWAPIRILEIIQDKTIRWCLMKRRFWLLTQQIRVLMCLISTTENRDHTIRKIYLLWINTNRTEIFLSLETLARYYVLEQINLDNKMLPPQYFLGNLGMIHPSLFRILIREKSNEVHSKYWMLQHFKMTTILIL